MTFGLPSNVNYIYRSMKVARCTHNAETTLFLLLLRLDYNNPTVLSLNSNSHEQVELNGD